MIPFFKQTTMAHDLENLLKKFSKTFSSKKLPSKRPNLPNQKGIEGSIQVQRLFHKAYASSRKTPPQFRLLRCGFFWFLLASRVFVFFCQEVGLLGVESGRGKMNNIKTHILFLKEEGHV